MLNMARISSQGISISHQFPTSFFPTVKRLFYMIETPILSLAEILFIQDKTRHFFPSSSQGYLATGTSEPSLSDDLGALSRLQNLPLASQVLVLVVFTEFSNDLTSNILEVVSSKS